MKVHLDMEKVRYLYYDKKLSVAQVADILGCAASTLQSRMKANGMTLRSQTEALQLSHLAQRPHLDSLDTAEIVRLYRDQEMSLNKLSLKMGVSQTTIRKRLIDAGCPIRNFAESIACRKERQSKFSESDVAEMERLYVGGLSPNKIGDRFECTGVTVRSQLIRKGVPLRSSKKTSSEAGVAPATETYTPSKRLGKVFEPIRLLSPEQVTPETVRQLRDDDELLIDDIAVICSMTRIEIFNILEGELN